MEGGCDPTTLPCTSAYSPCHVGKQNGVHEPWWAEWSCRGSVCCGLSWWMPLSLCFPKRQGLCLLLCSSPHWEDGSGAAMQVCDYLPGQNPWDGQNWVSCRSCFSCMAPTWTAGPGLPPLSPAWLLLALGLATSSEAQILQQLSGAAGTPGAPEPSLVCSCQKYVFSCLQKRAVGQLCILIALL